MSCFQRLRTDGRAEASGPWLFALAAVILLLAADVRPAQDEASPGPPALLQALETARRGLAQMLEASWSAADPADAPEVRALQAAEALRGRLDPPPSWEVNSVHVRAQDVEVVIEEPGEGPTTEYAVSMAASLRAASAGKWVEEGTFERRAPDPLYPLTEQTIRSALAPFDGAGGANIVRAFAGALARELSADTRAALQEPEALVRRALSPAARAAAESMAWSWDERPPVDTGDPNSPGLTDIVDALSALSNETAARFLSAFCVQRQWPAPVCAALEMAAGPGGARSALLLAAQSAVGALKQLALRWGGQSLAQPLVDFVQSAATHIAQNLRARLEEARAPFADFAAPGGAGKEPGVLYEASHAVLNITGAREPALLGVEFQTPFELEAIVSFDLTAVVRLAPGGPYPSVRIQSGHVRLPISFPSLFVPGGLAPFPGLATAGAALALEAQPIFGHLQSALARFADEVGARFARLQSAVWDRISNTSASIFSRLLFHVANAVEGGDANGAVAAVMELLERFVADDLRDALTVNFTWRGLAFSLIPDPVRQQVSLQGSAGPDTFGARLRRVPHEGDLFNGKWKDPQRIALEIYWVHTESRLQWTVTVDPFMRTNEGMLRLSLRSLEREGLRLELTAPVPVARNVSFEAWLLPPGPAGVPVFPLAGAGYLALNVGVRARSLESPPWLLRRLVLRAAESAWADVVEGQSVGEVAEQLGALPLAQALLRRFIDHVAGEVAREGFRWLDEVELLLRLSSVEAGGAASQWVEAGIAVREPFVVAQQVGLLSAFLATAALRAAFPAGGPGLKPFDLLPQELHTRVGIVTRASLSAGGVPFVPGLSALLGFRPAVLSLRLYLSLGALAAAIGVQGTRWIAEGAIEWEGLARSARTSNPYGLDRNDAIDVLRVRAQPLVGARLLISEVLPAPRGRDSDLEFVEIYNPNGAPVSMDGWALRDSTGHAFAIPPGVEVAPGGVVLLARSSAPFLAAFGRAPDVGTLTLTLNDEGDSVTLVNDEGVMNDRAAWGLATVVGPSTTVGMALSREIAQRPPIAFPYSRLAYTGSAADFVVRTPSPGVGAP